MPIIKAQELEFPLEVYSSEGGMLSTKSHVARVENRVMNFISGNSIAVKLIDTDSTLAHPSGNSILNLTFQSIDKETYGKKYHANLKGRNLHYLKWHFEVHPLQFLDDGVIIITICIIGYYLAS